MKRRVDLLGNVVTGIDKDVLKTVFSVGKRVSILPPTCRLRSETEGVIAITLLVFCSVAANAGEQPNTAGRPRLDDGIVDGAIAEPPSVAPVQALRPGCEGQPKFFFITSISSVGDFVFSFVKENSNLVFEICT